MRALGAIILVALLHASVFADSARVFSGGSFSGGGELIYPEFSEHDIYVLRQAGIFEDVVFSSKENMIAWARYLISSGKLDVPSGTGCNSWQNIPNETWMGSQNPQLLLPGQIFNTWQQKYSSAPVQLKAIDIAGKNHSMTYEVRSNSDIYFSAYAPFFQKEDSLYVFWAYMLGDQERVPTNAATGGKSDMMTFFQTFIPAMKNDTTLQAAVSFMLRRDFEKAKDVLLEGRKTRSIYQYLKKGGGKRFNVEFALRECMLKSNPLMPEYQKCQLALKKLM